MENKQEKIKMANVVPFSFAQELLKGAHNFTTNTIKLALYTAV